MSNLTRIRLTRLPSARDLEYLVLRYLQVDGVYDVPAEMATELIGFGCASCADGSVPLSPLVDALAHEFSEDCDD